MTTTNSNQISDNTKNAYFTPVSDLKCPFCKRNLLFDPENLPINEMELHNNFKNWVYADFPNRYSYIDDTDQIYNDEDQLCHEVCYYQKKD